ncbi:MAG: amidohydrolase family protein [Anaerolineales bacterium]|nr:amidohydrolase family protein [Anaerolineales bacterium]
MELNRIKTSDRPIALVGGRLINGIDKYPLNDSVIIIEGAIIKSVSAKSQVRIPENSRLIDVSGKTVLPGFIDMHVHLAENLDLASMMESQVLWGLKAFEGARCSLMAGVTTVRDVGGPNYVPVYLRDAINSGIVEGPRIITCGASLSSSGNISDRFAPGVKLPAGEDFIVDGIEDLKKAVRRRHKMKVDWIKFYATGGINHPYGQDYSDQEMQVIINEAHSRKIPVCVHASMAKGTLAAVRAGVDTVEHGYQMTEEIAREMVARGTYLVATLFTPLGNMEYWANRGDNLTVVEQEQKENELARANTTLAARLENQGLARELGVKLLFGTDIGYNRNRHGRNLAQLEVMVQLGMSRMDIILSATKHAAEALGLGDKLGVVEEQKLADIVVVDGDPLENLDVLAAPENLALVIKDGCIYKDLISQ